MLEVLLEASNLLIYHPITLYCVRFFSLPYCPLLLLYINHFLSGGEGGGGYYEKKKIKIKKIPRRLWTNYKGLRCSNRNLLRCGRIPVSLNEKF